MSTHAAALAIGAFAYRYARTHVHDPRFSFGTGKLGELAGFASAVILALIALFIGYESVARILAGELSSRVSELAGRERRSLVLVCRTDKRSATAARLLREAGFAHVAVLRSGMEQWNEERLPVEAATDGV